MTVRRCANTSIGVKTRDATTGSVGVVVGEGQAWLTRMVCRAEWEQWVRKAEKNAAHDEADGSVKSLTIKKAVYIGEEENKQSRLVQDKMLLAATPRCLSTGKPAPTGLTGKVTLPS
jgi:hypothetical protein